MKEQSLLTVGKGMGTEVSEMKNDTNILSCSLEKL